MEKRAEADRRHDQLAEAPAQDLSAEPDAVTPSEATEVAADEESDAVVAAVASAVADTPAVDLTTVNEEN